MPGNMTSNLPLDAIAGLGVTTTYAPNWSLIAASVVCGRIARSIKDGVVDGEGVGAAVAVATGPGEGA